MSVYCQLLMLCILIVQEVFYCYTDDWPHASSLMPGIPAFGMKAVADPPTHPYDCTINYLLRNCVPFLHNSPGQCITSLLRMTQVLKVWMHLIDPVLEDCPEWGSNRVSMAANPGMLLLIAPANASHSLPYEWGHCLA